MHLRLLLLLFLLCPARPGSAQVAALGGFSTALAGASTARLSDAVGETNPAAWGAARDRFLLVHAAILYEMTELRLGGVVAVIPTRRGSFAFGARTFGFEQYRETLLSLGYGRALSAGTARPLYAGMRIRSHVVAIPGYGSAAVPTLSAGLGCELLPGFTLGLAAANFYVMPLRLGPEIRRALSAGIAAEAGGGFVLAIDAWKEIRMPADVRVGVEAHPSEALVFRVGTATAPVRWSAGVGIHSHHLFIDMAAERHPFLGWSPSISLGLQW